MCTLPRRPTTQNATVIQNHVVSGDALFQAKKLDTLLSQTHTTQYKCSQCTTIVSLQLHFEMNGTLVGVGVGAGEGWGGGGQEGKGEKKSGAAGKMDICFCNPLGK